MSEMLYKVPEERLGWAAPTMPGIATCTPGRFATGRLLGRARKAHRLDQALYAGEGHVVCARQVSIHWFEDGITNVSFNCIDRHLAKRGDQVAIIWEGDDPNDPKASPTAAAR